MDFLLTVMGMVMIVEGIPYFGFPERMRYMMRKAAELDDRTLRISGAALMTIGLIAVFIGRKVLGS